MLTGPNRALRFVGSILLGLFVFVLLRGTWIEAAVIGTLRFLTEPWVTNPAVSVLWALVLLALAWWAIGQNPRLGGDRFPWLIALGVALFYLGFPVFAALMAWFLALLQGLARTLVGSDNPQSQSIWFMMIAMLIYAVAAAILILRAVRPLDEDQEGNRFGVYFLARAAFYLAATVMLLVMQQTAPPNPALASETTLKTILLLILTGLIEAGTWIRKR